MIIENISLLFPMIGVIINLCLLSYILSFLRNDRKSIAYILFALDTVVWQFSDVILWSPISDVTLHVVFLLLHIPILIVGPLFLYFIYVLIDRKPDVFLYTSFVLFVVLFLITATTDLMYSDVLRREWGVVPEPGLLHVPIVLMQTLVPIAFGLALLISKTRRSSDIILKKQIRLVLIGCVATLFLVIFVDLFVPYVLKLDNVPTIGSALLSVQSIFFFLAVTKYRFLSMSIHQAAHEIFSQINDGVILVDRKDNIMNMNDYFREILGIPAGEKASEDILYKIREEWVKEEDYKDRDAQWGSGTGQKDLLLSQASLIQHGLVVGKVLIARDITEILNAQAEKEQMLHHLARGAHQAGMAEIASTVLHNFGNTLNSVNIAVQLVKDMAKNSRLSSLSKVSNLFAESKLESGGYSFDDTKGELFLKYTDKLSSTLQEENKRSLAELERLEALISTMEKALKTQNKYVHVDSHDEEIDVSRFIDEIIEMKRETIEDSDVSVHVQLELEKRTFVRVQRSKISHLMNNLISNALDALDENEPDDKKMIITVEEERGELCISVQDNGSGIDPELFEEIFRYGYTTKHEGEGLGLHIASIYAKEMGGRMDVSSPGLGKGSTFRVILGPNSWHFQ